MFTVCSKCNLRLTVTATDLRAAQGYVRCGRCHNVFNALAALADDPAREAQAEASATATQSRPALTLPEPRSPALAAPVAAAERAAADTSLEFNPASTNINEVFIEAALEERTGTFESITLSADEAAEAGAALDAEPVSAPQARSTAPALAEPAEPIEAAPLDEIPFMSTWAPVPLSAPEETVAINAAAAGEIAGAMRAAEPTEPDPEAEELSSVTILLGSQRTRARLPRWVLQGTVAVMILCLTGQVLHHYRDALAATPVLHRPLTALYQALGQPLTPGWDIARYEVRQLGMTTDGAGAGALVVRASISNRASRDQPLPLLRVVMQDRFGNRVAARDLKPAEYLGRGAPLVSLMAPGQRVDVQVAFQDPGQAATGFEIDACMTGHAGTVTCANDPAGR